MQGKTRSQKEGVYRAPLEQVFDKVITPFEEFIHNETTSGLILMACTILALIMANSVFASAYHHFFETAISLNIGGWEINKSLHHWINDGLMALFFFLVGLEIKREILVGELSDTKHAALPVIAAIGGMVVPAAIFVLFNLGDGNLSGWGIPMATDIAFAVGAMVLLGKRVNRALLTFLVALAIADDLGGVLVIAIFYTANLDWSALGIAALIIIILMGLNIGGIRKPLPYLILGVLMWFAFLKSGVHATIAGVVTALTIPARPKYDPGIFSHHVRELLQKFDASYRPGQSIMKNEVQRSILQTLENGVHMVETPLQRLEHSMHLPVGFIIIPIFALANAGIPIELSSLGEVLTNPITMGVMFGLIFGKLIGIAGFSWLAIRFGIASLPENTHFKQIIGVALLGGIGFTMAIFIGELAYAGMKEEIQLAKTGVLFASLIAGVSGYVWLRNCGSVDVQVKPKFR